MDFEQRCQSIRRRVRFPEVVKSMSTDSLTFRNKVLGFFIPHMA
jgi:hypothetical protein